MRADALLLSTNFEERGYIHQNTPRCPNPKGKNIGHRRSIASVVREAKVYT